MIGTLRPVGERTPLFPPRRSGQTWPNPLAKRWFESGTAALAATLRLVVKQARRSQPSVILPAYTCPDVISAIAAAGARARIVDSVPGLPWLDQSLAQKAIDRHTVAIIAPAFLGLRHPMDEISEACSQHGLFLVEDSAQRFPRPDDAFASVDAVVLSFGRGKPMPVGGGALVLGRRLESADVSSAVDETKARTGVRWRIDCAARNIGMTRLVYGMVSALPGSPVGKTEYKPLPVVRALCGDWVELAERAIGSMALRRSVAAGKIRDALPGLPYEDVAGAAGWNGVETLLRYPILARDQAHRDETIARLVSQGLGATAMYGKTLADIPGIPPLDVAGDLHQARNFASRLVTLPCHSEVEEADLARMVSALSF